MHFYSYTVKQILFTFFIFILIACSPILSFGDALFIHDYEIDEFLMGEQKQEISNAYCDQQMLVELKTSYTGTWMKRIFGEVKQDRQTTIFFLDKDQIQAIDWNRDKIIIYPLNKFTDVNWIEQKAGTSKEAELIKKERYQVLKPILTIKQIPGTETINGYKCRKTKAVLKLETIDKKKNTQSITTVNQQLWLSSDVPGIQDYIDFQKLLTSKLGIDAERLGPLSFLLRYWEGNLDPIRKSLKQAKGYPVKSNLTVEAQYIQKTETDNPKIITKIIKEESMNLRQVSTEKLDPALFQAPSDFLEVNVR